MSRIPYPSEYREHLIELVRSGRSPEAVSKEFGLGQKLPINFEKLHQDAA